MTKIILQLYENVTAKGLPSTEWVVGHVASPESVIGGMQTAIADRWFAANPVRGR